MHLNFQQIKHFHKDFVKTDKAPTVDDLHYQLEISFSLANKIRQEFIAWAKDKQ